MKRRQILLLFTIIALIFGNSTNAYSDSEIIIISFKFQRTVLKVGDEIPIVARLWNNSLNDKELNLELKLSENLNMVSGSSQTSLTIDLLSYTEVSWIVTGSDTGSIEANLSIAVGPGDTINTQIVGNITNQFWKQKEFLLSAWSPPSNMQLAYDYYEGANFGFNLMIHTPFNTGVNLVKSNNMKCYVLISEAIPNYWEKLYGSVGVPPEITSDDLELLDPTLNAYKNEPSVDGYSIIDEPGASRFSNLAKVVSHIREKDPTKLSYINLFPTYASNEQLNTSTYSEYVSQFLDEVKPEMLSYDHYHFFTDYDGGNYFNNLGIIRDFGLKYNIPYTNIIQLIGTEIEYSPKAPDLNWRTPTPEEHRFLVYSSLAYGYTGIVWFHWQHTWGMTGYESSKKDELYATVTQLNKEIKNIGDEILKLKSTGVYHISDVPLGTQSLPEGEIISGISGDQSYVAGIFQDSSQADYFMIMSKDYTTDSQTTISLNKILSNLEYFNVENDTWNDFTDYTTNSTGSEFSILITAGNGILFRPTWNTVGIGEFHSSREIGFLRNYPNPFNSTTTIEYSVSKDQEIELSIYNILGEKIITLEKEYKRKGLYSVKFDASDLPIGIYVYTIKSNNLVTTRRMIHSGN